MRIVVQLHLLHEGCLQTGHLVRRGSDFLCLVTKIVYTSCIHVQDSVSAVMEPMEKRTVHREAGHLWKSEPDICNLITPLTVVLHSQQ